MADARFEDILEYFLHNDSGDEFEGFTPADLCVMGDITAASVEHDSETNVDEENIEIPDGYSHTWLLEFSEMASPSNTPVDLSHARHFFSVFHR